MNKRGIIISLLLIFSVLKISQNYQEDSPQKQEEMEDTNRKKKKCFLSKVGEWACHYKFGNDFEFTIKGIGKDDATVIVDKTKGEDGDYQIHFLRSSHCVLVRAGGENSLRTYYFNPVQSSYVSLKDGVIYESFEECF